MGERHDGGAHEAHWLNVRKQIRHKQDAEQPPQTLGSSQTPVTASLHQSLHVDLVQLCGKNPRASQHEEYARDVTEGEEHLQVAQHLVQISQRPLAPLPGGVSGWFDGLPDCAFLQLWAENSIHLLRTQN